MLVRITTFGGCDADRRAFDIEPIAAVKRQAWLTTSIDLWFLRISAKTSAIDLLYGMGVDDMNEAHGSGMQGSPSAHGCSDKPGGLKTIPTAIVVDDVEAARQHTGEMLRRLGYEVHLIRSPADAMFEFHRTPSDFFLTAYDLPEINGYQLGRWIKRQRPHTWVVLITGLCRMAVTQQMADQNIDAWLFTPFRMGELQAALMGASRSKSGGPPPPRPGNDGSDGLVGLSNP